MKMLSVHRKLSVLGRCPYLGGVCMEGFNCIENYKILMKVLFRTL